MEDREDLPDKAGFKEPYEYPVPKWIQYGMGLVLLVGVLSLLWENLSPILGYGTSVFVILFVILFYVFSAVNLHIHERIHLIVGRLLGYDPEITIHWHHLNGYANSPGEFVDAKHNVVNLLSPLTLLGFLYSIGLFADVHWAYSLALTLMLAANTGGSGADVVGAVFDYNLPEGSLVYYPESGEQISFIYEPES